MFKYIVYVIWKIYNMNFEIKLGIVKYNFYSLY